MKKIYSVIIVFAIVLLSNTLLAQTDRSVQTNPETTSEFKISENKNFVLDNGLKVIVAENHNIPHILYLLTVDVDPVFENDAAGYVSMSGDLLRSGTKNKSKKEIDEAINFIHAELHTYKNGMYGKVLTEHKNEFLEIMSDVLLNPSYPNEELEKTKEQLISDLISSNTDPSFIANRVGQKLRNQNHPYAEITTEESINKITRDLLISYHYAYFRPNVSYLVIVGDITLEEAKKDTEEYFASWKKANVLKHEYQFPNKNTGTRVALVNKDSAIQSYIQITYPVNLKIGEPNAIRSLLANDILGSNIFSACLSLNLCQDKAYTQSAYSTLSPDPLVGYFSTSVQVSTNVTEDVVYQIIVEMNRVKDELVDDETLDLFKTAQTESFARSMEDPQTMANFAFNTLKYKLPVDYYQTYLNKVRAITKEQIQSVSKKYIDPNQAIIVVVGDKNKLFEPLKKFSSTGKVEVYDIYGNPIKENLEKLIPEGVSSETVLEKYIEAIGGKDNLEKIQDLTIVASTNMNGMEIKQKTYKKAPNKYAMIMSMNGNVMMQQAFDGERGIMKGFQGEQEILDEDLENLKIDAALNAELKYSELGVKVTLEAIESIEGTDAYKLKIVNPTGQTTYDYFDVNSGLKVQSKQTIIVPQGEFTQIQDYSDYQEIDGVKFPLLIKASGVQNMELKVDSVIINSDLSEDLF